MANPRRSSLQFQQQNPTILPLSSSSPFDQQQQQQQQNPFSFSSSSYSSSLLNSLFLFLRRPSAFPFLLSVFVLLTWLSLRLQRPSSALHHVTDRRDVGGDADANLARLQASAIAKDRRGWLLDPILAAQQAGIVGGAQSCSSLHVGEIRPGGIRGNHRHHTCNETFIIWGADTKFRLENAKVEGKGYAEVGISSDEVIVAASPAGTAHALINVDALRTSFFLGCQDSVIDYNSSTTDFNVWKDL